MLHNLIVIGDGGPRREPLLPRRPPSEVRRCRQLASLLTIAPDATCVVLAGQLAGAGTVAAVRAVATGVPIVVVTPTPVAGADVTVSNRDCARGRLAGIVRYLAGEPPRTSARIAVDGEVHSSDGARRWTIVDLAEGGVRVRGEATDADHAEQAIELATVDGLRLTTRARLIRHHGPDQAVFGFIGLHATDPQRLRAWMTRAGGIRVCA